MGVSATVKNLMMGEKRRTSRRRRERRRRRTRTSEGVLCGCNSRGSRRSCSGFSWFFT